MPELQQCSTLVLTAPAVLKAVFLQRFYLRGWLEEHVMAAVCAQQGGTSPVVPHLYDDTTTVEHRCLQQQSTNPQSMGLRLGSNKEIRSQAN